MTTLFISHSSKDKAWAERTHAALAKDYQCLFLDSHPDDGIHAGSDWEQTLYQRLRQSRGVVVLCSANWLASPWCVAEAMMARDRGKRVFLLATADVADDRQVKAASNKPALKIPDFLKDTQFVSLGSVTEDEACRRLLHGLEKEGLRKKDFKQPDKPYPGLMAFDEKDAAVYFGRDDEIDEVIAVLNRRRRNNAHGFILVLGASGCGKSSLVRAGVLPRLRCAGGDDGARAAWVIVPPLMGGRGLDGLALSLAHAFEGAGQPRDFAVLHGRLGAASDLHTLGNELLAARNAPDSAVLLVLDQLEEVFGTPEGSEQRTMLRLLLDASADASSPLVVLATMRSDFLNAFQLFEGAAGRYKEITLDSMPKACFGTLIEGPADRFGLKLDSGLSQRMAEDTAYSDALPLLAFTLEKLYKKFGADGHLELKEYEQLFPEVEVCTEDGRRTTYRGVSAAIKHVADGILSETGYASLSDNDRRKRDLRDAFNSLAQVGAEGQFTRRTARWSEMPSSCEAVLKRFVNDRLLVSGKDENGHRTLCVAHEALFRVWDTLASWLQQDRKAHEERAARKQRLSLMTREWKDRRGLRRLFGLAGWSSLYGFRKLDLTEKPDEQRYLRWSRGRVAVEGVILATILAVVVVSLGELVRGLPAEALGDYWAYKLVKNPPLPELVRVPDERFVMESDRNSNEHPIHRVPFDQPFYIGKFEVTFEEWDACVADGGCNGYRPADQGWGRETRPVINVSWGDAQAYVAWLSRRSGVDCRLPSAAEWEYAARAGTTTEYALPTPSGSDEITGHDEPLAHCLDCGSKWGNKQTAPVGSFPHNNWCLHDMHGNVFEWVDDCSPHSVSCLRGGSWFSHHSHARSAANYPRELNDKSDDAGFRVVCLSPLPDSESAAWTARNVPCEGRG